MGLAEHKEGPKHWWTSAAGGDGHRWEKIGSVPFVDATLSPALPRALYIPFLSQHSNKWMEYVLLQRRDLPAQHRATATLKESP